MKPIFAKTPTDESRSGRLFWTKALETLKAVCPQGLYLSLFGMAIPLLLFNISSSIWGIDKAKDINALLLSQPAGLPVSSLMETLSSYSARYFALLLGVMLIVTASYLGILRLVSFYLQARPLPTSAKAWLGGLRLAISPFAVLMVMGLCLLFIGQIFLMPSTIILSLFLMTPVLIVAEGTGAISSIWRALTLKYAKGKPGMRRFAFFYVFTIAVALLLTLSFFLYVGKLIAALDNFIPVSRELWAVPRNQLPFGPTYLLRTALVTSGCVLALFSYGVLSTVCYYWLRWLQKYPGKPVSV